MANLNDVFTVHPRKRVARTPIYDRAGRPMPTKLSDVYGSYSDAKYRRWCWWYNYCKELHGERFCITSHNCSLFTISFASRKVVARNLRECGEFYATRAA